MLATIFLNLSELSEFDALFVAIPEVDIASVAVKVAENDGITALSDLSAGGLARKRVDATSLALNERLLSEVINNFKQH